MADRTTSAEGAAVPWAWPAGLAVVAAALFGSTWTDAIQAADSGEVVAAACNLGVAHPPGYPLHTLLGHALCALPGSTPAGRVGLLSVLAGVWAVLMVYGAVLRLNRNPWAAAVAGLTLATGSVFWRHSSVAEVFALNAALCGSVVYLALTVARAPAERARRGWSALLGVAVGLALSNHHSATLVLPLAAVALAWPRPTAGAAAARTLVALAGCVVGLLPYLQLVLADPDVLPRWGQADTLEGLIHHVLRRDYGTFSLTIGGEAEPLANLWHFARQLPSQLGYLLWPLALLGGVALFFAGARRPLGRLLAHVPREVGVTLALLPLLAGPLFLMLFNIAPEGIGAQVAERFHILPTLLLAIAVGVGLGVVDATWLRGEGRGGRRVFWHASAWVVLGLTALRGYTAADMRDSYTIEDYGHNALSVVERGALVLGVGDVRHFSILYAQQVLGVRPDVQYVDVKMLLHRWYVHQKRRERPRLSYRFTPGNVDTLGLIQAEQRRGVPVYLAVAYNDKVMTAFGGYPVGPLYRLLPPGRGAPGPLRVAALNRRLFRGMRRRGRAPHPERDPWSAMLREAYARTWRSIARMLFRIRDRKGAVKALVRAQGWAPWLPVPKWFGPEGARGTSSARPDFESPDR